MNCHPGLSGSEAEDSEDLQFASAEENYEFFVAFAPWNDDSKSVVSE